MGLIKNLKCYVYKKRLNIFLDELADIEIDLTMNQHTLVEKELLTMQRKRILISAEILAERIKELQKKSK